MRKLTATICLTIAVFLGSVGCTTTSSDPSDFQKASQAYDKEDYATALREWKPLAEQGNARAQVSLGEMYAYGNGVEQNFQTAARWFKASAQQGNASAQHELGLLYFIGEGVKQDYEKAVGSFTQSAEQGHQDSQYTLANIYHKGSGVPQNLKTALMWYKHLSKGSNHSKRSAAYLAGKIKSIEKELK